MNERVKLLTKLRLDMNKPYIHKWPEVDIFIKKKDEKVKNKNLTVINFKGSCSDGATK